MTTTPSTPTSNNSALTTAQCLAAQQFIQDSLANTPIIPSSTPLIQQFAEEIAAVNGQSNAPQQLTTWLTNQGYATTPQAIYQAFVYDQGYELWFWNGVYGNTQVQYPNSINLNISSQGVITLSFGNQAPIIINNPVVTPANGTNPFTVVWTLSNNSTAGSLSFPSNSDGYIGTLQLGEQSPAFMLFAESSITSSSNANTLAGWQGNYSLQLYGFAPVLTISPDSSGNMSVALGGIPLQNVTFVPNADQEPSLSWSSSDGNSTSGNITFAYYSPFTIDTATNTADFVPAGYSTGNSFWGTLTYTVNNQLQSWNYFGLIGKPQSFPLSQFFGNYGATSVQSLTGGILTQGNPLIIQSNGQGQTEVLYNGTVINDWEYDSAYNLLTWTATSGNTSAAYLTFAPPIPNTSSTTSSSSSANISPTFWGTLTENGTTQNFQGCFSEPSDLSSWIGSYGTTFLTPQGSSENSLSSTSSSSSSISVGVGPSLEVYLENGTPQVMLTFSNAEIANIPTTQAQYDQQTATLTWNTSTPIVTSGAVAFTQQTAPTTTSNYVGNQFAGTLTLPQAIANLTAQTYNYNGVIGQPNFNPDNPSSTPQNPNNSSSSTSNSSFWNGMKQDAESWQFWVKTIIGGFVGFLAFTFAETVISAIGKGLKALGKAALDGMKKLFSKKPPEMQPDNAPEVDVDDVNNQEESSVKRIDKSPQELQQEHQQEQQVENKTKPEENPLEQQEGNELASGQSSTVNNQTVQSSQQTAIDNADGNLDNEQSQIDSNKNLDSNKNPDSNKNLDDKSTGEGMDGEMMGEE